MSDPKDLIEKAERFIEQQRELYGEFSTHQALDSDRTAHSKGDDHSKVEEEATEYKSEQSLSQKEKIAACRNLEELRELCAEADDLKTDLEGTNLVFGVGNPTADLMIIGEAPGFNEDKQGEPFVGKAGQLLDKIMEAIDFRRSDIYIANILKHRPPNNKDPKPEERQRSLPYLLRQIELVDPKLILCVGRISATTLLNKDTSLSKLRQTFHKFHDRELLATYHPAALLRNKQWKRPTWEDVQLLRKRYDELGGK